eukprot:m51a1_g8797 hypothetical protein (264) ;mRNA; f:245725-247056
MVLALLELERSHAGPVVPGAGQGAPGALERERHGACALCLVLSVFAVVALGVAPACSLDDALGTATSAHGLALRLLEDVYHGFVLPWASVAPTAATGELDRISAQGPECAREVRVALGLLVAVVASAVVAFAVVPAPLVVLVCSSFALHKTLGTVSVLFFRSDIPSLTFQNESRLVLPALALQFVRVVSYSISSTSLSFRVYAYTVTLACLAGTALASLLVWAFVLVVPQMPGEKARLALAIARSVLLSYGQSAGAQQLFASE